MKGERETNEESILRLIENVVDKMKSEL